VIILTSYYSDGDDDKRVAVDPKMITSIWPIRQGPGGSKIGTVLNIRAAQSVVVIESFDDIMARLKECSA
jgi:hypothetical protein